MNAVRTLLYPIRPVVATTLRDERRPSRHGCLLIGQGARLLARSSFAIALWVGTCAMWASPAIAGAEHVQGEIKVCISPAINCAGFDIARFDGGSLSVNVRHRGHDERSFQYVVQFDNRSDCEVTISTTMMRHGDTLNVQTLDFGNIDLSPRQSRESQVRSFSPSPTESKNTNL